jgi:hypothetical protein
MLRSAVSRMRCLHVCEAGCFVLLALVNLDGPIRKEVRRLSSGLTRELDGIDNNKRTRRFRIRLWRANAVEQRQEHSCLSGARGKRDADARCTLSERVGAGLECLLLIRPEYDRRPGMRCCHTSGRISTEEHRSVNGPSHGGAGKE